MTTRNIVPRLDGEGSLGKHSVQWGNVDTKKLNGIILPLSVTDTDKGKALIVNEDGTGYEIGNIIHSLKNHEAVTLEELNSIITDANLSEDVIATDSIAGIVKIGSSLNIEDGIIDVKKVIATDTTAGLIKVGNGLNIDNEVLNLKPDSLLWPKYGTITSSSTNGFTVENNNENDMLFTVGRPIRLFHNNIYTYHIILTNDLGVITVSGDILNETDYNLCIGSPSNVVKIDLNIPDLYADVDTSTLILDKTDDQLNWDLPKASLIGLYTMTGIIDTSATTQAMIRPIINDIPVFDNIETTLTRSLMYNNADINFGNSIEFSLNIATGEAVTKDAKNLSITMLFVLH